MNPLPANGRFEALDAWRGICALMVATMHFHALGYLSATGLVHNAYRFVDFFFVLSGFVIAHAYQQRLARGTSEVGAFLIRRFGRIWPMHVVMLAAFVAFECANLTIGKLGLHLGREAFGPLFRPEMLPAQLAMMQSWGFWDKSGWNWPSWSISAEFGAYLLFALIASLVRGRAYYIALAAGTLAGAVTIALLAPQGMENFTRFGLARCLFGFGAGALVRAATKDQSPVRLSTITELFALVLVVAYVAFAPRNSWGLLAPLIFAVAVWVFAYQPGHVSVLLQARVPQLLGRLSYSIYIVHAFLVMIILLAAKFASLHGIPIFSRPDGVGTLTAQPKILMDLATIAFLLLVVGIAYWTHRWIEVPGQRFFNRLAGRRGFGTASAAF